jgi:hypothetical protein
MKRVESYPSTSWAAAFLPLWIARESEYAWGKFSELGNPQQSALKGGLLEGGKAHLDLVNYFSRFMIFWENADGDKTVLLKASSALGKFVNAGRILNAALIEDELGVGKDKADELAHDQLVRLCAAVAAEPMPDPNLYFDNFDRDLLRLAKLIEDNSPLKFQIASDILKGQIEFFVAFSEESGVIAEPGVSSSEWAAAWRID